MTEPVSVEPTVRRRRRWPIVVAVLVVAAAATAGTTWVMTRGDDAPRQGRNGSTAAPQPDLHYVLGAAPDTWVGWAAFDSVPGEYSISWPLWGDYQTSMYGTTDDPTAPALILGVGDQLNDGGFAGIGFPLSDQTQWTSDRTSGICGTDAGGVRRCFVTVDGTQVQSHSTGFSTDDLTALLMTTRVRGSMPEVDEASLPAGTVHLGSWRNAMPSAVGENGDAIVSTIKYQGPDNALAFLTIGRADEHDIAAAFDMGAPQPTTVDGVTYYRITPVGAQVQWVVWQQDGIAFQLLVTPGKGVDVLDLARSARLATTDEWAAAVAAPPPHFDPSPGTTLPGATGPQLAPQPDSVVDVDVTVTAAERQGAGGLEIVSALPDGASVPVVVLREGSNTSAGVNGEFITWSGPDDTSATIYQVTSTTSWGAYVITSDAGVAALRVTRANGDRYVAELVPDPTREGLRVAAVVVPVDEFVGADLIDEFGTVIDKLGLPAD